jgi:plasmid stabilization system protein ParE
MNQPIALQLEARNDVVDAALWYERQKAGLSEEFFRDLREILSAIEERPTSFPVVRKETRRALLRRFPYAIYFRMESDFILVMAIVHTSRSMREIGRRLRG